MPEHDPGLYARSFADIYDEWYADLDDPQHLVAAFSQQCAPGDTIVEFGGGTGRLAIPLASAGFNVISLDISAPMLASAAGLVHSLVGDMTHVGLRDGCAQAVFVAYNTIFNLDQLDLQQQCLSEAARLLRPSGVFAVEAFVAPANEVDPASPAGFDLSVKAHPSRTDSSLAIITGPADKSSDTGEHDQIVGSHIELTPEHTTCRPWRLAYQSPTQFDEAAWACGLAHENRMSDWAGAPFRTDSARHVSWYRQTRSWPAGSAGH